MRITVIKRVEDEGRIVERSASADVADNQIAFIGGPTETEGLALGMARSLFESMESEPDVIQILALKRAIQLIREAPRTPGHPDHATRWNNWSRECSTFMEDINRMG